MKSLFSFVLACCFLTAFSQNDIFLHPFVGEDRSEVILAYNRKSGISMEWYYDDALKKMNKAGAAFQLPVEKGVTGTVQMKAYIDPDGTEVILVWSPLTGKSSSWFYDHQSKSLKNNPSLQLPADPGVTGDIQMFPYIGSDGSEVILVWDTKTGKSVSWYFEKSTKTFKRAEANFQLPASTGVSGKVMMHPYIGKDKSEVVLIWDMISGKSVSWYLDNAESKYKQSEGGFQLPAAPGVTDNVIMFPYLGTDGSEVILTWSMNSGQSVMWYFENSEEKFKKADAGFQLPAKKGIIQNVLMFPFVNPSGDEVIYIWNSATGQSENYYFDDEVKAYKLSEARFQLPGDPLK